MRQRTAEERYHRWVQLYAGQVRSSCARRLYRRHWLVDDAVARVFELLWEKIEGLPDDDTRASRWLAVTARNVCTNLYRHFQAELPADSVWLETRLDDALEHTASPWDVSTPDPPPWLLEEDSVRSQLYRSWLYECMDTALKSWARSLIQYVFALGQPEALAEQWKPSGKALVAWFEAQGQPDLSPDAARMKLRRALEALHACIQQKEARHLRLKGQ